MTLIATIAAIALVAVGIGYAYTAMTTNSGNSASAEYITVVQGGNGSYQFSNSDLIYWDSVDYKITDPLDPVIGDDIALGDMVTKFSLTSGSTTITPSGGSTYTVVQVGDSFTLKFAPQTGGQPITGLSCVISSDSFALPSLGVVIVKVNNGSTDSYYMLTAAKTLKGWDSSLHTWTVTPASFEVLNSAGSYTDATVTVYYGYEGTTTGLVVEHASGASPAGPPVTPISSANMSFTVDTTWLNDTPVTAFTVSKASMTITGTASDTATVTYTPTTANRGMSVVSSNTGVATVTYDASNGVIKVTGVSAGSATITITPASGSVEPKTITVTVN